MTPSQEPARTWYTPSTQLALTAVAVIAYAAHSTAWIARQMAGGTTWPPLLETTYVSALVLWIGALSAIHLGRAHRRRTVPTAVLQDERTRFQFMEAHRTALVIVLLAQVPFFLLDVPTRALAQFTVTTSIVALAVAYAWHSP